MPWLAVLLRHRAYEGSIRNGERRSGRCLSYDGEFARRQGRVHVVERVTRYHARFNQYGERIVFSACGNGYLAEYERSSDRPLTSGVCSDSRLGGAAATVRCAFPERRFDDSYPGDTCEVLALVE